MDCSREDWSSKIGKFVQNACMLSCLLKYHPTLHICLNIVVGIQYYDLSSDTLMSLYDPIFYSTLACSWLVSPTEVGHSGLQADPED